MIYHWKHDNYLENFDIFMSNRSVCLVPVDYHGPIHLSRPKKLKSVLKRLEKNNTVSVFNVERWETVKFEDIRREEMMKKLSGLK